MSQTAAHLAPSAREAVAAALNQSLAETVVATLLAQNFHWNVKGMAFGPLHALFQTIYEDHFAAQDDLAERARAIDMAAGGSLAGMLKRSKVADHDGQADAATMIRVLLGAQETLAGTLSGLAAVAEAHGDLLTQDLAVERGQVHEKFAWMLRAHLG
jgi:starvation-inducible DNA-binding protein